MRWRLVGRQLGLLLLLLSACMFPSAIGAGYYHFAHHRPDSGQAFAAMVLSAGIGTAFSLLLLFWSKQAANRPIGRREALLLVALTWVLGAALAALPFRIWAAITGPNGGGDPAFGSYLNCYFEAMSGLTTTGSSVLARVESIPRSLLLWRAFIQWLGGLGIVVLFVAVLPILGVGGKRMFRFETPGPKKEGVRPRIRAAAQILWLIYVGITAAQVAALKLAGLDWFDAACHAFTTMATGGFSTYTTSVAGMGHWRFELIITLFMFLAAVNFSLYDQLLVGRWRLVLRNPELRAYAGIILGATAVVFLLTVSQPMPTMVQGQVDEGILAKLRHSLFTVVSLQTTTGFCTADYDYWPFPVQCILVALMFIGGCAGSTGGGIKVIRFIVLAKVLIAELEAVFRPGVIRTVRVGNSVIDPQMRSATLLYFVLIAVVVITGTVLVLTFESPAHQELGLSHACATAFSAVAATLNNIGPGLDRVGPTGNYAGLAAGTKVVLCALMVLGRLELYAFLVLLVPWFWREE